MIRASHRLTSVGKENELGGNDVNDASTASEDNDEVHDPGLELARKFIQTRKRAGDARMRSRKKIRRRRIRKEYRGCLPKYDCRFPNGDTKKDVYDSYDSDSDDEEVGYGGMRMPEWNDNFGEQNKLLRMRELELELINSVTVALPKDPIAEVLCLFPSTRGRI